MKLSFCLLVLATAFVFLGDWLSGFRFPWWWYGLPFVSTILDLIVGGLRYAWHLLPKKHKEREHDVHRDSGRSLPDPVSDSGGDEMLHWAMTCMCEAEIPERCVCDSKFGRTRWTPGG